MSTQYEIAHLSDLHFSVGAFKDGKHVYSPSQLQDIGRILGDRHFDKLVVTGDLTDSGDPDSLLRARDWLFKKFSITGFEDIGLTLEPDKVVVVPGNHDAFNLEAIEEHTITDRWQKSLANFYSSFPEYLDGLDNGCRYDWIDLDGRGVFIVYVDTCLLGDPGDCDERETYVHPLKRIPQIARGKVHVTQSETILAWFARGIKGKLPVKPSSEESINGSVFAGSLKILMAHHYLFEPRRGKRNTLLRLNHRDAVFGNLATADFDVYLCGHKHVSDYWLASYATHLDRRGAARHLFNLMRRALGLDIVPLDIRDDAHMKMRRAWTFLLSLVKLMKKVERGKPEIGTGVLMQNMVDAFREGIVEPKHFERKLTNVLTKHKLNEARLISAEELKELQRHLVQEFSKAEIQTLKEIADRIQRLARRLAARPFLQILAGSAGKRASDGKEPRSFNIYTITADKMGYVFKSDRYVWKQELGQFIDGKSEHARFEIGEKAVFNLREA